MRVSLEQVLRRECDDVTMHHMMRS